MVKEDADDIDLILPPIVTLDHIILSQAADFP